MKSVRDSLKELSNDKLHRCDQYGIMCAFANAKMACVMPAMCVRLDLPKGIYRRLAPEPTPLFK